MTRYDLVLLHPPSIYDFRERPIFYGPIADVIPSSPVFEMYPVGFITLASHLRRHGFRTRIVNLALMMMRDRRFETERYLRRLRPTLFGIDLHWLPHVHGSLEVARRVKRVHPDVPTVFGGISASYFQDELIRRPEVDFILRGSVCEPSLLDLVRCCNGDRNFDSVPNLTWKQDGEVRVNPEAHVETDLDAYGFDLGMMVRQVVTQLDFWSAVPYHTWWRHPITAVFTVRGCDRGCAFCGASHAAFGRYMRGPHPNRLRPQGIAERVKQLAGISRAPIFLVGDLLDGGLDHARAVVDALAGLRVPNRIVFEFFAPPPREFVEHLDRSLSHWAAELSPESHDESIRARLGKASYSNGELEAAIEAMLATRCEQLDLFLIIGLAGQTRDNVMETIEYVAQLFERFDRRLSAFITPLGPFLDPGSDAFEMPERHGYRLFARTLEEHRLLLENRDWEHLLSYETRWMTRRDIVEVTYDAAMRLNAAKLRSGRVRPEVGVAVAERLEGARDLHQRLRAAGTGALDATTEQKLRAEVATFSTATLNDKVELFPPRAFLKHFRLRGIARLLLRELVTPHARARTEMRRRRTP
jgi:B12-binding domain/radical SAM domain protein